MSSFNFIVNPAAAHVDGELLSLNLNSLDVKLLPKALEVVVS